MNRAVRRLSLALTLTVVGAIPAVQARAAGTEEGYRRLNDALVENYLLPRYRAFSEAADTLRTAAVDFCEGTGVNNPEAVRQAFDGAMDVWMGLQHVDFGPAELFMRSYRIYFWPQARGKIGAAVREMLAAESKAALSADPFRDASVAVQGLPAVEYLIYPTTTEFKDENGKAVDRCDLLQAVTVNLDHMAEGLVTGWTGGTKPFTEIVHTPGPENPYFQSAQAVTLAFFKSFHGGLQLILDAKLKPVIGGSIGEARPKLAESSLSGRSLANIVLNLESLRDMYEGAGGTGFGDIVSAQGGKTLDDLMRKAFRMTIETARSIPDPLTKAVVDPGLRPRLEKLETQVQALKQIVKTRLAEALDVGVGFNALDGD